MKSYLYAHLLMLAIPALLAACFNGVKPSADQLSGQVEMTVAELLVTIDTLGQKELGSRDACARLTEDPKLASACKPRGYYMTKERGKSLIDWLTGLKVANRFAQDGFKSGAACVAGKEIEVLGLTGCIAPEQVIGLAYAGVLGLRKQLEAQGE